MSVLLAASAAACGSSSGSSGGGGEASDSEKAAWADTAYPEPDEAKMKEYATRLMNPDVDVNKLAPEIQTALMVAHTPLTDAQQKVFDKCMTQDTCETGTGKYYLAIVDDQVNTYYSVSRAETTAYAIKTGAIAKISYNTVNMNVQQYLSNFRTAIGQKADLIVSNFGGLGNQAGQVIAQAKAAGIPMTNGVATLSEDVMSKLSVQFSANLCDMWANGAQSIADKLEEEGKPLTYSLFTGPAGNAYAAFWQPCAEKALDEAGMKKVYTGNTEWTPQGTVKAAAALRASGKKPSLIAYDTFPENFMQAYIDAGDKDMPAFALTGASDIGTAKAYKDAQDAGLAPIVFVSPNNTWLSSIELSINLAIKDGKGPSSTKIDWPVNFSDFEQFVPQFDLTQNNFAFLGSPLSAEEQAAALKQ
ncbi:substrate-binding domain-containing protein [Marmoricola sp. Leaf446]|uniref:substrate-binding domain-containing protein n=1 Tax=Marmoricola sp. Leaf446 TaxID=1736379 RepID=UPI0012E39BAD|nr:substrate-binding domain-containing protein [Marmoricola sp. Leaf446]